jgi:hypothetical protein
MQPQNSDGRQTPSRYVRDRALFYAPTASSLWALSWRVVAREVTQWHQHALCRVRVAMRNGRNKRLAVATVKSSWAGRSGVLPGFMGVRRRVVVRRFEIERFLKQSVTSLFNGCKMVLQGLCVSLLGGFGVERGKAHWGCEKCARTPAVAACEAPKVCSCLGCPCIYVDGDCNAIGQQTTTVHGHAFGGFGGSLV